MRKRRAAFFSVGPPGERAVRPCGTRSRRTSGLEEAKLSVTAGGAQRNPRYAHTLREEPRRGVYATDRHGHGDLFEADHLSIRPTACALYVTVLKRTATDVRLPALEKRQEGIFRPIHPMEIHLHPINRPIQGMEIPIQGQFLEENWGRFVTYSGEILHLWRPFGGASQRCI